MECENSDSDSDELTYSDDAENVNNYTDTNSSD